MLANQSLLNVELALHFTVLVSVCCLNFDLAFLTRLPREKHDQKYFYEYIGNFVSFELSNREQVRFCELHVFCTLRVVIVC